MLFSVTPSLPSPPDYMPKAPPKQVADHRFTPLSRGSMQPQPGRRPSAGAWNPQEDEVLVSARAQGMNWAPIQQTHFPTKTPNACRKRHERLMERRNAEDWDTVKLETLCKEYMNVRKEMWSILSARLGEKWQTVEAKCMEKGLKNLQSGVRSAMRRERLMTGIADAGMADVSSEIDIEADDDESSRPPRLPERCEPDTSARRTMPGQSIASLLQTS
ncbi:hypothetical protein L228DRAFT_243789 [Xylona heveae TC161]|uniref:Myb-like domain-containing protein n=1 Tax=Xylona heveae (strain CBS 132557 / TC161) TaxID=1328760 RepID=A0A165IK58_XYLHT|nr:hypothetical protein L228DRAFT_243789 [Xylona heveae TC161]KZF25011.1 hypothetical protein L228DRAFT_243789 [Xylona heveae TC161]